MHGSCHVKLAQLSTHLWKVRAILPEPSLEPLEFVLGGDAAVVVRISGIRVAVLRWCPGGGGGRRREEGRHG